MEEQLKQGQRIEFDINGLKGEGKIVGVATNGAPIIGKSYIIEPDVRISNEVYDYSHFVAWEFQLKLL
jgi:hypothetical protein